MSLTVPGYSPVVEKDLHFGDWRGLCDILETEEDHTTWLSIHVKVFMLAARKVVKETQKESNKKRRRKKQKKKKSLLFVEIMKKQGGGGGGGGSVR